jgi:hypothetical protein
MLVPVLVRHTLLALTPHRAGFKGFASPAPRGLRKARGAPLMGLDSPSESTRRQAAAQPPRKTEGAHHQTAVERLPPLRSRPLKRFPHPGQRPQWPGLPHPTACACRFSQPLDALNPPRACRPCFMPDPLLGFALQSIAPPVRPYAVADADPLLMLGPSKGTLTVEARRSRRYLGYAPAPDSDPL